MRATRRCERARRGSKRCAFSRTSWSSRAIRSAGPPPTAGCALLSDTACVRPRNCAGTSGCWRALRQRRCPAARLLSRGRGDRRTRPRGGKSIESRARAVQERLSAAQRCAARAPKGYATRRGGLAGAHTCRATIAAVTRRRREHVMRSGSCDAKIPRESLQPQHLCGRACDSSCRQSLRVSSSCSCTSRCATHP